MKLLFCHWKNLNHSKHWFEYVLIQLDETEISAVWNSSGSGIGYIAHLEDCMSQNNVMLAL